MVKILVVIGTRPEAIKMAPVVKALEDVPGFTVEVCITAQHRELLDGALNSFDIEANYDLNVMRSEQSLHELTTKVLLGVNDVLEEARPAAVLVHGDTTTSYVSAVAAFYKKIPVCHVEAGLRTGNIFSPFPEEFNRKAIATVAALNFAPTDDARKNLIAEGVNNEKIFVTGNTVIDALLLMKETIEADLAPYRKRFNFLDSNKKLVLLTSHRRENVGKNMEDVFSAVRDLAVRNDVQVVFPVHPNPQIKSLSQRVLGNCENVFLLEPQDYEGFVFLMLASHFILTDSGGIQEEAASLSKPVLVLRNETERNEAIRSGMSKLVGTDRSLIIKDSTRLLEDVSYYESLLTKESLYGEGKSSETIAIEIQKIFSQK